MEKKILIKLMLLFVLGFLPYLLVKCYYVWNYDINYYKARGKAEHLILGISRAKRGLSPAIIQEELQVQGTMLNFAFNNLQSPYGPDYYRAIKRKVKVREKPGVFILSISPGSVMELVQEKPERAQLREASSYFYALWFQNCRFNLEYILRSPIQNSSLFQFVRSEIPVFMGWRDSNWPEILHPDGWAELDAAKRPSRLGTLIVDVNYRKSPLREQYLEKTIDFLKQHGSVVLVRLPVSGDYLSYESELYPGFDERIESLAARHKVVYLNYCNDKGLDLIYHDGHHLFGQGARAFSRRLAKDVRSKIVH